MILIIIKFEVGLKNSAAPPFFNSLLRVWISDETLFLAFDISPATDQMHDSR